MSGLVLSGLMSSFLFKVHFLFQFEIAVPHSGGKTEEMKLNLKATWNCLAELKADHFNPTPQQSGSSCKMSPN